MTKMKKITKSTFAIIALSLVLVAVLAFGGTYAYFSAHDEVSGSTYTGILAVSLEGGAESYTITDQIVVPNQNILANDPIEITYDRTNIPFYIRAKITAAVAKHDGTALTGDPGTGEPTQANILAIAGMDGWTLDDDGFYYLGTTNATICEAGSAPESIAPTITIDDAVGCNGSTYYMDAKITVTITVDVIQQEYLGTHGVAAITIADLADAWNGYVATAVA